MTAVRIALVGDPIGGSVSPALQNAAFQAAGLPCEYTLHPVPRGALAADFPELRERYVGLNVTTPHKEAALALVDTVGDAARACGSVNTIAFGPQGAHGDSTDGAGFLRALHRATPGRSFHRALLLGAGGAARAVAAALAAAGSDVGLWSREPAAARAVASEIAGVSAFGDDRLAAEIRTADLLVSAVPAAAWTGESPPLPSDLVLSGSLTVFDLAYRPRRTPLLDRAGRSGCVTIEGIEMLIEQGALSFTMWTGQDAPLAVMREAAYNALRPPEQAR